MKLWEIAGWLLMLMGLYIFYVCFVMLVVEDPPRFVQSLPMASIGVVVFRGGIHLLKVAAAAQTCRQFQAVRPEGKPAAVPARPLAATTGLAQTPVRR